MGSDTYKRRLAFSFTVINFGLKQLSTIVKSFITKGQEYKAILKFKIICIHCHAFLSDDGCSCDFLLMSLYIYSNTIIMVADYCSSLTYAWLLDREMSTCLSWNPHSLPIWECLWY